MTAPTPAPAGSIPSRHGVRAAEISDLIAWMRRLSDAGVHRADPAELAAFHHAKQELLARIEDQRPPDDRHAEQQQRPGAADQASSQDGDEESVTDGGRR